MRRLLFQMMVSLDGYFEGRQGAGDIGWHVVDDEFNDYAIRMLRSVDTLVFGRVTYQLMAGYWPTPEAISSDPVVAELMNRLPKLVFSRTLEKAEWSNTRLVRDAGAELAKLKPQPGGDLMVLGSGNLMVGLTQLGLIDEYRVFVAPVALGGGTPLFQGLPGPLPLKLVKSETHRSGNVLLYYVPASR